MPRLSHLLWEMWSKRGNAASVSPTHRPAVRKERVGRCDRHVGAGPGPSTNSHLPGVLSTPLKIKTSAVYAGLLGTPDGRTQIRHATRHATRVVWRPSHRTQEIDVVSLPSSVDGVVRAFFLSFVTVTQ